MDTLTKERRSWNMAQIRGANTQPERLVRSVLQRLGARFRLHRKHLPGHPDIVLPRYGLVVLVHGCFWHRHRRCRYAYTPRTRLKFWTHKFERTVARDKKVRRMLRQQGWKVAVIWECETRDPESLASRLGSLLREISPES